MEDSFDDLTAAAHPADRKPGKRLAKRLVVFADGTGNAFGGQASNIWRLYQAMDKRGLDPLTRNPQLARYIPGVGTSSIGLVRLFDGATGSGVPNNVRKLYRFLCWNWAPGDEIWMFGFSRGAFTVRTLAGLIKSQGLMPREIGGRTVTRAEMARNALGAWRAYRRETAPFRDPHSGRIRMSPTVSLGRFLQDSWVGFTRRVTGQKQHREVIEALCAEHPLRCPGEVRVRFLGLFDTVEAYGVPLEEVRSLFDFWVWPISFRNRVCSSAVQEVRHALSLDDERLTYHPLRFDQTPAPAPQDGGARPNIKEVWFSGVHSDIGGGYPDDEVSLEPLTWMIREARAEGLDFIDAQVADLDSRRSKNALVHDSRSGLKSAYRFAPRPVESGEAFGGKPVVHSSVVEKILTGGDGYSPIMLTNDFLLYGQPQPAPLDYDPEVAGQVGSLVMWRRIANVAFITVLVLLLAFPLIDDLIRSLIFPNRDPAAAASLPMPEAVTSLGPGFVEPWLRSFSLHPEFALPLILAAVALYFSSTALRDRIKDTAQLAWSGAERIDTSGRLHQLLVRSGRRIQASRGVRVLYDVVSGRIVPLILVVLVSIGGLKLLHVAGMTVAVATGAICDEVEQLRDIPPGNTYVLPAEFSPQSMCWPTGVKLVQGRTYWIKLEETVPFTDAGASVPLAGFRTSDPVYILGSLIRRTDAHWFQPMAQIAETGRSIVSLEDYTGNGSQFVPRLDHDENAAPPADCGYGQERTPTGRTLTARVRADATGSLFLFVNDAIFWPGPDFYRNNGGCARVTISAEPGHL